MSPGGQELTEERRPPQAARPRREHILHQLGFALIWLSTIGIAFMCGYTINQALTRLEALIWVWLTVTVLAIGIRLFARNRHRRDQDVQP